MKIRDYLRESDFVSYEIGDIVIYSPLGGGYLQYAKVTDKSEYHLRKPGWEGFVIDRKTFKLTEKPTFGLDRDIIKVFKGKGTDWRVKLKKYIMNEATITRGYVDTGGVAGDDDAPTGNILMGRKYTKKLVETPGGSYRISIPEDEWTWDEFEHAKGMEDRDNYHSSLGKQGIMGDRLWRHTKRGDPEKERRELEDISKKTESAPEYVKRVTKFSHTRDDMKKNLPDVVFKISDFIGQFQTASGEESEKEQKKISKNKE